MSLLPSAFRAALVGAALLSGAAHGAEPVHIRIGWVATPPELPPILFAKDGLARHLGQSYTVEPIHFASSPTMITALASGGLDIAPLTFFSLALAIENARLNDLRIIADEFQDGVDGYFTGRFLVRKDSPIETIDDLKGKVLASLGVGGSGDMAMRTLLRRHHLEAPRDYTVLEVPFADMKPMLSEGKVDLIGQGVGASDPALAEMSRVLFTQKDALGKTEASVWTARTEFLTANRAALVDFMEDTLRSIRWYTDPANHAEAIQILVQFTKLPAARYDDWAFTRNDAYRDPNGLPDLDALQRTIDTEKDFGFLKDALDITHYADLGIVTEAAARLK